MNQAAQSLLLAALSLPTLAMAHAGNARGTTPMPIYNAGSQYTATLDQTHNLWRLQPLSGQDVVIATGACATGAMVPTGVWLLVLDGHGGAELLAPSTTHLPAGARERIALRACDRASGTDLAVPQSLLDLLAANTGAIYVSN